MRSLVQVDKFILLGAQSHYVRSTGFLEFERETVVLQGYQLEMFNGSFALVVGERVEIVFVLYDALHHVPFVFTKLGNVLR